MTAGNPTIRLTVQKLLRFEQRQCAARAGSGGPPSENGEAAARLYQKLADRLTPLIGAAGVSAMLARSARIATKESPCLAALAAGASGAEREEPADCLRRCLRDQPPEAATEASVALLTAFWGLLETFIGEALTARLILGGGPDLGGSVIEENDQ